jgi:hypothetical protein
MPDPTPLNLVTCRVQVPMSLISCHTQHAWVQPRVETNYMWVRQAARSIILEFRIILCPNTREVDNFLSHILGYEDSFVYSYVC